MKLTLLSLPLELLLPYHSRATIALCTCKTNCSRRNHFRQESNEETPAPVSGNTIEIRNYYADFQMLHWLLYFCLQIDDFIYHPTKTLNTLLAPVVPIQREKRLPSPHSSNPFPTENQALTAFSCEVSPLCVETRGFPKTRRSICTLLTSRSWTSSVN